MHFEKLEDKQLYYRNLGDYRLLPNCNVIVMLDGRSFSKLIKNKFEKPFDDTFINMMNKTAQYLCQKIQGCKFAYVQSDEISLFLCDHQTPNSDSFFAYRLTKMCSIIASLATGKFNQLYTAMQLSAKARERSAEDMDFEKELSELSLVEFDCKAWNVPSDNDVYGWFLYRQIDCIRNSKSQAAQTYLSHKVLLNKTTDEQIQLLEDECQIKWADDYDAGKKYGRFIYKETEQFHNEKMNIDYERSVWNIHNAFPLTDDTSKEIFYRISGLNL